MSKLYLPPDVGKPRLNMTPVEGCRDLPSYITTRGFASYSNKNKEERTVGEANSIKGEANENQKFLDKWNELGGRRHLKPNTKVYQQALTEIRRLRKGTYYNDKPGFQASAYHGYKFTFQEFEKALQNFNLALTDPNFYPSNKKPYKNLALPDFLYNPFVTGPSSKFLNYLENPPDKNRTLPFKCHFPDLRSSLVKVYDRELLGDIGYEPGRDDWRDFSAAANKLGDWYERHKQRIPVRLMPITLAQHLLTAIFEGMSEANRHRVMPYWLKSTESVERQLPKHLFKEGLLSKSTTHRREDRVGMTVDL